MRGSFDGRPYREPDDSSWEGRFGANLRQLRLRYFKRIDDFVVALSSYGLTIGKTAVSQWELGERIPRLVDVPVICQALGVTPNSLILPFRGHEWTQRKRKKRSR